MLLVGYTIPQSKVGSMLVARLVSFLSFLFFSTSIHAIAGQRVLGRPSRDKFKPIANSPIALVPLSIWGSALAAVDQNPTWTDPCYRSPNDWKYMFLEPGIFIAANDMRRARYFATWKSIEPACIHRLSSSTMAPPLSNQEWRDILIGDITSNSPTSKSALAQEQACYLLGSAMDELCINLNVATSPNTSSSPVDDSEACQILWWLTEFNFRFELLALDKRAGVTN